MSFLGSAASSAINFATTSVQVWQERGAVRANVHSLPLSTPFNPSAVQRGWGEMGVLPYLVCDPCANEDDAVSKEVRHQVGAVLPSRHEPVAGR
jgi:hypothetical protein